MCWFFICCKKSLAVDIGGDLLCVKNAQSFLVLESTTKSIDEKPLMELLLMNMKSMCSSCPLDMLVVSNGLPCGECFSLAFQNMLQVHE